MELTVDCTVVVGVPEGCADEEADDPEDTELDCALVLAWEPSPEVEGAGLMEGIGSFVTIVGGLTIDGTGKVEAGAEETGTSLVGATDTESESTDDGSRPVYPCSLLLLVCPGSAMTKLLGR